MVQGCGADLNQKTTNLCSQEIAFERSQDGRFSQRQGMKDLRHRWQCRHRIAKSYKNTLPLTANHVQPLVEAAAAQLSRRSILHKTLPPEYGSDGVSACNFGVKRPIYLFENVHCVHSMNCSFYAPLHVFWHLNNKYNSSTRAPEKYQWKAQTMTLSQHKPPSCVPM